MTATVNDFNLSYIGQGPSGVGQVFGNNTPGPLGKTLVGYGVLIAAATTGTTITSSNVGWIDGIQSLAKTFVLSLQSVDAPITYQGTANTAFYHSVQANGQVKVGDSITTAGFTNSGNNATNTVTYVLSDRIGVTNASSVAETNPAGTLTDSTGGVPKLVSASACPQSTDTNGAVTGKAAATLVCSAVTATGCVLNYTALATTSNSVTVGFTLEFAS